MIISVGNRADEAAEAYLKYYNCAQAIMTVFAPETGLDPELARKMVSNLSCGARNGEICGAVSAALLVLGMRYGYSNNEDQILRNASHEKARAWTDRFREKHGSIVCKELLNNDPTDPEGVKQIEEQGLFLTTCPELVRSAAALLDEILNGGE